MAYLAKVGSAVKSKVYRTNTDNNDGMETKNGFQDQ